MIMNRNINLITALLLFFFIIASVVANTDTISKKKAKKLQIEMGGKLTIEQGCVDCHSPKILVNDILVPDPARLFSGHPSDERLPDLPEGFIGPKKWFGLYTSSFTAWGGPWGVSYAANLTPDKKTGIGAWTEENFISIIKLGIHSSLTRKIIPPMPWDEIGELSDEDLKAIFQFLKTVKPIKNKVPKSTQFKIHENLI